MALAAPCYGDWYGQSASLKASTTSAAAAALLFFSANIQLAWAGSWKEIDYECLVDLDKPYMKAY